MKSVRPFLLFMLIALLVAACQPAASAVVNTEYILTTDLRDGKFVFVGVNEPISGMVNPPLSIKPGERVTITLINSGDGEHDLVIPELKVQSKAVSKKGETTSVTFTAPDQETSLTYQDSRHVKLGMSGTLQVSANANSQHVSTTGDLAMPSMASGKTVEFTLVSGLSDGKMVFIGKGGEIDGKVNPDLQVGVGDTVKVTLISGEGAQHNFYIDEFGVKSADVTGQGNSVSVEFVADKEGTFAYYCGIPGHRQAGMEGKFIVGSGVSSQPIGAAQAAAPATTTTAAGPADPNAVDIVRDPTDLPGPIGKRGPEKVVVNLETIEVTGRLADGTTYRYWTFNGKVPGPFLRVRVGDTVEVHLKNHADSTMTHSVDFHAVTGPGGGAVATQTQPGGETMFTFKALNPGLYVYHCATPMVAHHIANGMYGLILVEPEEGLPAVDHEFYVMQGELYTAQPFGTTGHLSDDTTKLLAENPEYFVFNGASMALTTEAHAMHAKTGETVRIFFGVGGPNFTSSFHVIGEIFDRVFDQASLTSNPLTNVQTTLVPPGGATMVEFKVEVPGRYILVDHALSRLQRGLAGYLMVEGDPAPDIFDGTPTAGSGH
jgi:nitrite reductase (NO-forming)